MSLPTASFPTSVWTGVTATRVAADLAPHAYPTPEDWDRLYAEVKAIQDHLRTLAPTNIAFTGIKTFVGDGVDATSADAPMTFTGIAAGERVLAVFGHVKTDAGTTAHTFTSLVAGTDFATTALLNAITLKQAAGNQSTKAFVAIVGPALTSIAA